MLDRKKIYTPNYKIPICSVDYKEDGTAVLQFKKSGEKEVEEITFQDFIAYLTSSVYIKMIESPNARLSQLGSNK